MPTTRLLNEDSFLQLLGIDKLIQKIVSKEDAGDYQAECNSTTGNYGGE